MHIDNKFFICQTFELKFLNVENVNIFHLFIEKSLKCSICEHPLLMRTQERKNESGLQMSPKRKKFQPAILIEVDFD